MHYCDVTTNLNLYCSSIIIIIIIIKIIIIVVAAVELVEVVVVEVEVVVVVVVVQPEVVIPYLEVYRAFRYIWFYSHLCDVGYLLPSVRRGWVVDFLALFVFLLYLGF